MTKQQAIEKIQNSFPSIWSREDVLTLVNQIDATDTNLDLDNLNDKIREAVDNAVNNMSNDEIVDISTCEFSIRNGNEIEIDSIGINTSDIVDEVMKEVSEVIENFFEEEEA
jgi:hypothetical protein